MLECENFSSSALFFSIASTLVDGTFTFIGKYSKEFILTFFLNPPMPALANLWELMIESVSLAVAMYLNKHVQ